jgi:hypothetical protein
MARQPTIDGGEIDDRRSVDRSAGLPRHAAPPAAAACWTAHWLLRDRHAIRLAWMIALGCRILTQRRKDAETQKCKEKKKITLAVR